MPRAEPADAPDAPADAEGDAGEAEAGVVADEEAVPSPVDAGVQEGVDPDGEQEQVLDRAQRQVAEPGVRAAEEAGLEGVAGDPQAGEQQQAAPGDPRV